MLFIYIYGIRYMYKLRLAYECKNIMTNPYVIKKIPIFADKELLSTIECTCG